MILVEIPGDPRPQGRPRAFRTTKGVRLFDPESSRSWKGVAQVHMKEAMQGQPPLEGPLALSIVGIFTCPVSHHKKRTPLLRRWHLSPRCDLDNLAKAVMDAGNGILWVDDRLVVRLEVTKMIAAQSGDTPVTAIRVNQLSERP